MSCLHHSTCDPVGLQEKNKYFSLLNNKNSNYYYFTLKHWDYFITPHVNTTCKHHKQAALALQENTNYSSDIEPLINQQIWLWPCRLATFSVSLSNTILIIFIYLSLRPSNRMYFEHKIHKCFQELHISVKIGSQSHAPPAVAYQGNRSILSNCLKNFPNGIFNYCCICVQNRWKSCDSALRERQKHFSLLNRAVKWVHKDPQDIASA